MNLHLLWAILLGALLGSLADWLFAGVLFHHRYQRFPEVWRAGNERQRIVAAQALAISAIGVLLFAGLTAYDTQKIKSMYFYVGGTDFAKKSAIMGALKLYLDFINLFLFLLRFMGDRR